MDRDGTPARPPRIPGFAWVLLAIPFLVLLAFVPWGRLRSAPPREFTNSIGMKFVRIDPGDFWMGSPEGEEGRDADETLHHVKITKGFYLGVAEVTQAQWRSVMKTDPSRFKGDDLPVEAVSWNQSVDFCKTIGKAEGKNYRLPTEAEWEYACRAGSRGPYGGTGKPGEMGWNVENSQNNTHPVGKKRGNGWGLHDMHGNVWEWCADWKADYGAGEASDPKGPETGTARVLRGGAWVIGPRYCRSARRDRRTPDCRYDLIGFRAVVD